MTLKDELPALQKAEIEMLQQARRGAQSLAWAFTFGALTLAMYLAATVEIRGVFNHLGMLLVCLLTSWLLMLFFATPSKWLVNALLRLFSPRQRRLARIEAAQRDRRR